MTGIFQITMDLAEEVIKQNFKELEEAGCKHIQLDEPLFAVGGITREEVEAAIEANTACFEGITAYKWEHVCQGNYAVREDYDGQIDHRYFDVEPYPTELIVQLEVDAIMNKGDMTSEYEGQVKKAARGRGRGRAGYERRDARHAGRADRGLGWNWLPSEQTLIMSSCGMNHLPREVAYGKLAAMAGARDILRG